MIFSSSDVNSKIKAKENAYKQKIDLFRDYERFFGIKREERQNKTFEFPYSGDKINNFTIQISGFYRIEAWGARGGGSLPAPKGAYSKSIILLTKGEKIQILVGEKGYDGYSENNINCPGGGGGSFVAKGDMPLCVAGGGGGNGLSSPGSGVSFACGQSSEYGGDPNGFKLTLKMGGKGSPNNHGGGGGGFIGNGEDGIRTPGRGGISFINGGLRQTESYVKGYGYGGFGGGGSTHSTCGGSAGGGGYTGGSAGVSHDQGGGGGSYHKGFFNNEMSKAISGCDSSLPQKPDQDDGYGFVKLTLIKECLLNTIKKKITIFNFFLFIHLFFL